jgi:hypothetical protein
MASKRVGLALATKKGAATPVNVVIGCVAHAAQVRVLMAL